MIFFFSQGFQGFALRQETNDKHDLVFAACIIWGEGSWMFSLKILRLFLDLVDLWGLRFIDYWPEVSSCLGLNAPIISSFVAYVFGKTHMHIYIYI